jgi:hypothetical protein
MSEPPAPVDTKPDIEEKCKVQKCSKWLKLYDECAERVKGGHVHHEGANCSGQMFGKLGKKYHLIYYNHEQLTHVRKKNM